MLAVDTNVIVRCLTEDDPGQTARAQRLVRENDIVLATSVVLEAEWVLRAVYRFTRTQIIAAIKAFTRLPGVALREPDLVNGAMMLAEAGIDFADALHLAAAQDLDAFISFDRRLAVQARRTDATLVRAP